MQRSIATRVIRILGSLPLLLLVTGLLACDEAADPDVDRDGVLTTADNCASVANADQLDWDDDGEGDACDDTDEDGVSDAEDNCIEAANELQHDFDGDLHGDACDDSDEDGHLDADDNCREHPNGDQANHDGDLNGDACDDTDADGVLDAEDNCLWTLNADQANWDGDELGDACEDSDDDSHWDVADNCPGIANSDQADFDGIGGGDACADVDADGHVDGSDNCPTTPNPDQARAADASGLEGDACRDVDEDGVLDVADNCYWISNPDQANADGDRWGDACETDDDDDRIQDQNDNCRTVANAGQADLDRDGIGDVCDTDLDGDGTPNPSDPCPHRPAGIARGAGGDGCGTWYLGSTAVLWQHEALNHQEKAVLTHWASAEGVPAGEIFDPATGEREVLEAPESVPNMTLLGIGPGDEIVAKGRHTTINREVLFSFSPENPTATPMRIAASSDDHNPFDAWFSPDGRYFFEPWASRYPMTAVDGSGSYFVLPADHPSREFHPAPNLSRGVNVYREGEEPFVSVLEAVGMRNPPTPPTELLRLPENVHPRGSVFSVPGSSSTFIYSTLADDPAPGESLRAPDHIEALDLATGEHRRLIHASPGDSFDRWQVSPDGSWVASYDCDARTLSVRDLGPMARAHQIRANLRGRESCSYVSYQFNRDSSAIIFTEESTAPQRPPYTLEAWRLDGAQLVTLASGSIGHFPVAEGTKVLFTRGDAGAWNDEDPQSLVGLFVASLDGEPTVRLIDRPINDYFFLSGDGRRIAFTASWIDRFQSDVYAFDGETGALSMLTPRGMEGGRWESATSGYVQMKMSPGGRTLLIRKGDQLWSLLID